MLKTMKSEMLTITKKKSRHFCFTRIFTNFNYRRDNPTKYKALEGRFLGNPHLPSLLHPAPLHRPKTATCHPTHPCQSIAHHRPATCHPTLHCKSAYQNWTRYPTFQHLITTLHHPEIQQCPKQLPRKPLGSIHSRRS